MNYNQLRTYIIDAAENDDPEFATHVDDFIRESELRIYREVDIRAFRHQAQAQLTANDPYINLPAATDPQVRTVHIRDTANKRIPLWPKNYSFIIDYWPYRERVGVPRYYGFWGVNTLIVAPTPAYNFNIEMEYSAMPESIVTAGSNWVGDNAWELLHAGAMLAALAFMKQEQQAIGTGSAGVPPGLWQQRYKEALDRLTMQERREQIDDFKARGPT